jgi:hypothetical protein
MTLLSGTGVMVTLFSSRLDYALCNAFAARDLNLGAEVAHVAFLREQRGRQRIGLDVDDHGGGRGVLPRKEQADQHGRGHNPEKHPQGQITMCAENDENLPKSHSSPSPATKRRSRRRQSIMFEACGHRTLPCAFHHMTRVKAEVNHCPTNPVGQTIGGDVAGRRPAS